MLSFFFQRLKEQFRPTHTGIASTTHCEYWVYLSGRDLPAQDIVTDRVMRDNPVLTHQHALLMMDVRLVVDLVSRERNPRLFRPDLMSASVDPEKEHLEALSASSHLIRIRFVSLRPTFDLRHLVFIPLLAKAYADSCEQVHLIFDVLSEEPRLPKQFADWLEANPNLTEFSANTRLTWNRDADGAIGEILGMPKAGLLPMRTRPVSPDTQTLADAVVRQFAELCWNNRGVNHPGEFELEWGTFACSAERKRDHALLSLLRKSD